MGKLQEGLSNLEKLKSGPQGLTFRIFVEWQHSRSDEKNEADALWKQYLPPDIKI